MASDSTSIDDLPGGTNSEQQNRVVLEKTEIQNTNAPPMAQTELSSDSINKIISGLQQASSTGMHICKTLRFNLIMYLLHKKPII